MVLDILPQVLVGTLGLYLMVRGAGVVVDRSIGIASRFDVPDILIAMTIISIGTSLPEIASHVIASVGILTGTLDYEIASATVLGGNMGSTIAQGTLVLGMFILGYGKLKLSNRFLRTSYVPMLLVSGLTLAFAYDGTISRLDGLILFGLYLVYFYYSMNRRERSFSIPEQSSTDVKRDALIAAGGFVAVLGGAFTVLIMTQDVVTALGLGGSMIGVMTIGIAAALPELTTIIEAVRRRAPNIAVGTLIGSNIVNPLLGIGIGGATSTYAVPAPVIYWDLPFKLVVGIGLLAYVYGLDRALTRRDGITLVILYFIFITARFILFAAAQP